MITTIKQLVDSNQCLISLQDFEKLPTPRKLAYFKKYRSMEHVGKCSICGGEYHEGTDEQEKEREIKRLYVSQMREILNKCEHVE